MSVLATQKAGDVHLFIFQSVSILDEVTVNQVAKEFEQAIRQAECVKVLIDLGRLEMMTSSMLGQLVKFKKQCDADDIALKLCNLSKDILKLFKTTRLDKVFSIVKTRKKALKSFG